VRIAHLAFTALPRTIGGLEVVVDNLMRAQLAADEEPVLITRFKQWRSARTYGLPYKVLPLPPNFLRSKAEYGFVGPAFPVAAAIGVLQARYRFDLWHIHSLYPAGWMAQKALRLLGTPAVLTPHGDDVNVHPETGFGFRLHEPHRTRIRKLIRSSRAITAISDTIADQLRSLGATQYSITPIPNGVDNARMAHRLVLPATLRCSLGLPKDGVIILTVGRNIPSKGYDLIPDALRHVRSAGIDATWVIVGAGLDKISALAKQRGVSEYMVLVPPISQERYSQPRFPPDRLIDIYQSADIFAFPSLSEGFALAVLEAMAAGTPVVASNAPGLRDLVSDGIDGLLFSPAQPEAMAKAIFEVMSDRSLRERIVAGGLEKAGNYDWKVICDQYLNLYRKMIG
jgi:glycosyltransferase involved in cell wall biosynthesis